MKARILIELDGQDAYEVGVAEGETEAEFTENLIRALDEVSAEMSYTRGCELG